jgi:hypothetical protein
LKLPVAVGHAILASHLLTYPNARDALGGLKPEASEEEVNSDIHWVDTVNKRLEENDDE